MYTRNLLIRIILLIILLTVTSFFCAWLFFHNRYLYMAVILPFILIETGLLIYLFNRTNHKIAYFFNALRNIDTTLQFPENEKGRTLRELHKSLNRVNRIFFEARKASETNEQFYHSLISHVRTGLLVFNKQGMIEVVNPAMEKIFATYNLRHISDFDQVDPRIARVMHSLDPGKPEIMGVSIENELNQLLFNKAILQIQDRELNIISVDNIKNELDHKELDSWIRLIRVLNHEIVNAVTPITTLSSTFYDLFHKEAKLSKKNISEEMLADTAKALKNIHEHGSGLMNFVNAYRQITRLPEPSFREIDLTDFIRNELYSIQNYPDGKHIITRMEIQPDGLTITGDPELLQRVFSNILINALQSMDKSSKKQIWITAFQNYYNRTIIRITDTGCGIPDDIKDQVFVPFFSTRENGSGIGLSLSRQIMLLHKGDISIESAEDEGSTVTLLF
jgi:two-component system nitrogen regulation sensor histidine kinase NtrY